MAMFNIESDKDKKLVNVLSFGKELPLLRYPILNNTYKVMLTTKEIKHCLDNGVIVEEVFDDGVVRLDMKNYDKDNSKAERFVELNLAKTQKAIAEEAKKKAEEEAKKKAEEEAKKKAEEEAAKKAAEEEAKKKAEEEAKKKAEEEAKKKAEAEAAAKKAAEEEAKKKAAEEAAKKQNQQQNNNGKKN